MEVNFTRPYSMSFKKDSYHKKNEMTNWCTKNIEIYEDWMLREYRFGHFEFEFSKYEEYIMFKLAWN